MNVRQRALRIDSAAAAPGVSEVHISLRINDDARTRMSKAKRGKGELCSERENGCNVDSHSSNLTFSKS